MKKFFLIFSFLFSICSAYADYVIVDKDTNAEIPVTKNGTVFNANMLNTSSDWEAVTGLNLHEYKITFNNTNASGMTGWEMYYLDSFPCYGEAQYVRTWVNSNSHDGFFNMLCIRQPLEVNLAYRTAKKDDSQGKTTGILKCTVDKKLSIDLGDCKKQDWSDYIKD